MHGSRCGRLLAGVILAAVTAASLAGIFQLRFEGDYKVIFRSDGRDWDVYLDYLTRFPDEERQLLAVVDGPVLTAAGLRALVAAEKAIGAEHGVTAVESVLSSPRVRTEVDRMPRGGEEGAALSRIRERIHNDPLLVPALVSPEDDAALLVIVLSDSVLADPGPVVTRLRRLLIESFDSAGLAVHLGGIPAIRVALVDQVRHDQITFNGLAAVLAGLVAWWLLGSVSAALAAALGPLLGVAWTLGFIGLLGWPINVLTQMVAALVMVVGYADSVHMVSHLRGALAAGAAASAAWRSAWREIGPACAVTSLTTAAGFASLTLADAWMVRHFGVVCAAGSLLAFVAVMAVTPVAAWWLAGERTTTRGSRTLSLVLARVATATLDKPRATAVIGTALTLAVAAVALSVRPDYSFSENLPAGHEVRTAFDLADSRLDGLLPLAVVVRVAGDAVTPAVLVDGSRRVAAALEEATSRQWLSIAAVLDRLPGRDPEFKLEQLPPSVADALLDTTTGSVLVNTTLPDSGSRSLAAFITDVEHAARRIEATDPMLKLEVTGIAALATRGSQAMIRDLGVSLAAASLVIFAMISLLVRSLRFGVICFIPNVAPLAVVAALLVFLGEPLRYASVLVFVICLGLAVDDTVHMIMRFRRERRYGRGTDAAILATVEGTGRVLVATTGILTAGFVALTTSATPAVVMMGALSAVAMVTALLVDLTLLPVLLKLVAPAGARGVPK